MPFLRRKAEEAASTIPALMIKAERAAMNIFHGEHAQRKSGAGEKFWQFREYTPTDRPQDIDWRQSGKTDRVFIRQKERQLPQTALFWAADSESMNFTSDKLLPSKSEAAKILTLALSLLMTHGGERIGVLGESQTGRSEATLEAISNYLATPHGEPLPAHLPSRAHKNAHFVLTGDFLETPEAIEAAFKSLAGHNNGLIIQILDPAEIELPWGGRAIFEDPAGQSREPVQNVPSIRDAYKQRIQNHIAAVETICRAHGWHYILYRTDETYEKTLMNVWALLSVIREKGAA